MQERGRNSAASRAANTTVFAARIEMPVVLRGGMLDDRPALVPAGVPDGVGARMPRRFGTAGWVAATVLCALSVYAVRDTMFAPLAKSEAPSSAWETRTQPGDATPALVAASGSTHIDLSDHDGSDGGTGSATGTASATGTTVPDVDPGPPSIAGGDAVAGSASVVAVSPSASPSVPDAGAAPESTADPSTSSTPSASTPDTLGGHGANSGGGKGGSGNSSGSP